MRNLATTSAIALVCTVFLCGCCYVESRRRELVDSHVQKGDVVDIRLRLATQEKFVQGKVRTLVVQVEKRQKYKRFSVEKHRVVGTEFCWDVVQPDFFLWPFNFLRLPIGLVGAAYQGLVTITHGAGCMVTTIVPGILMQGAEKEGDKDFFGLVGIVGTAAVDFPCSLLELPLYTGENFMPFVRSMTEAKDFPGRPVERWWNSAGENLGSTLQFAVDWEAYPPFFFWPEKRATGAVTLGYETKRVKKQPRWDAWKTARGGEISVKGIGDSGSFSERVSTEAGTGRIDLRDLALRLRHNETLQIIVIGKVQGAEASEEISYRVSEIRDSFPPSVAWVKTYRDQGWQQVDGRCIVSDPEPLLKAQCRGDDYPLQSVAIKPVGGPCLRRVEGEGDYRLNVSCQVDTLEEGPNEFRIIAEDERNQTTTKKVCLEWKPEASAN